MDKPFETWFSRFLGGRARVFLAASKPHLAAWSAHGDHAPDSFRIADAWAVGFGLAIAIDGVFLMMLFALIREMKSARTHATKGMVP